MRGCFCKKKTQTASFCGLPRACGGVSKKHHVHVEMTRDVLRQLPEALANPIAIFDEDRSPNTLVFMLELRDTKGKTVVAPVAINAKGPTGTINLVKTAFGRDRDAWFTLQGLNNAVRYVNTEKIKRWRPTSRTNPVFASNASFSTVEKFSNADGTTVLTEADLVNLKAKNPDLYQRSDGKPQQPAGRDASSLPRACGGVSSSKKGDVVLDRPSPRMRGCFHVVVFDGTSGKAFPAHAGVFPCTLRTV